MRHKTAMASAINLHNSQKATFLKAVELGLGQYSHIPDPKNQLSSFRPFKSPGRPTAEVAHSVPGFTLQKPLGFSRIFP
jgi:hypothetical protein